MLEIHLQGKPPLVPAIVDAISCRIDDDPSVPEALFNGCLFTDRFIHQGLCIKVDRLEHTHSSPKPDHDVPSTSRAKSTQPMIRRIPGSCLLPPVKVRKY